MRTLYCAVSRDFCIFDYSPIGMLENFRDPLYACMVLILSCNISNHVINLFFYFNRRCCAGFESPDSGLNRIFKFYSTWIMSNCQVPKIQFWGRIESHESTPENFYSSPTTMNTIVMRILYMF